MLGMGSGGGTSRGRARQVGGSEAGVAWWQGGGRISFPVWNQVPSGRPQLWPPARGAGWSLQWRKFPGTAACVTAGLAPPVGSAGGGGDLGAGRWAALAAAGRAARGAALEAALSAPGEAEGRRGEPRGWGVSCVPVWSPRRGQGGRRRRGRGRSALAATSHEQRPRGRARRRWPPLSPPRDRSPLPSTLSSALAPRGKGGGPRRDGEGRPARATGLGPLGARGPGLARPALLTRSLPPPGSRTGRTWSPDQHVVSRGHPLLRLRNPPSPTPPILRQPGVRTGDPKPGAKRSARPGRFWALGEGDTCGLDLV